MANIARLVDTTIFVDFLRGSQDAKNWLNRFPAGELAISVVTVAELLAGCRNTGEQVSVEGEIALYPVVWINGAVSPTALEWYRQFHLSHGVGFLDCLIAAGAYHHGMIISTLNDKHFRPFPELEVERPY